MQAFVSLLCLVLQQRQPCVYRVDADVVVVVVADNGLALGPVVVQHIQLFLVVGVPAVKNLLLGSDVADGGLVGRRIPGR